MNYLESEEALTEFIAAFENGTYPGAQWKHAEHLVLAACLPVRHAIKAATDRDRGLSRAAAARAIVDRFASRRDLFRDYYSFDLLASRDASARWIPPDRAPK